MDAIANHTWVAWTVAAISVSCICAVGVTSICIPAARSLVLYGSQKGVASRDDGKSVAVRTRRTCDRASGVLRDAVKEVSTRWQLRIQSFMCTHYARSIACTMLRYQRPVSNPPPNPNPKLRCKCASAQEHLHTIINPHPFPSSPCPSNAKSLLRHLLSSQTNRWHRRPSPTPRPSLSLPDPTLGLRHFDP